MKLYSQGREYSEYNISQIFCEVSHGTRGMLISANHVPFLHKQISHPRARYHLSCFCSVSLGPTAVLAHHGHSVNTCRRNQEKRKVWCFLSCCSIHAVVFASNKCLSFVYVVSPGYLSKLKVQFTISTIINTVSIAAYVHLPHSSGSCIADFIFPTVPSTESIIL